MNDNITFKLATLNDAKVLLECRNDILTRKASFNTDIVSYQEHKQWLERTINDTNISLNLVYHENRFIGTIRSNKIDDKTCELSWSLMPQARGNDLAKKMLHLFTLNTDMDIQAYIKKENVASIKVALFIQMDLTHEENGTLLYKRYFHLWNGSRRKGLTQTTQVNS